LQETPDSFAALGDLMSSLRTHRCGELRAEHAGKAVSVCGWMDTKRDRGGVVFILLRDVSGKVQLTFAEEVNKALVEKTREARGEYVLRATGKVALRSPENRTPKLATGEIEIIVDELEVLNTAVTPAIEVRDDLKCDPELRLKHRFIDLRRRPMQAMLQARARAISAAREVLEREGFLDVETPILYKRTPEGARDFIVPSRAYQGQFYALPQSPQLFKQLCMIAGLDRYYQIARCFRDEDKRADRQPEFTQIDIEMSFPTRDTVMELFERVITNVVNSLRSDERLADMNWPVRKSSGLTPPFERMTYEQAMRDYSIDRPDLRSRDLKLTDLTEWAKGCSFNPGFKGKHLWCKTTPKLGESWTKTFEGEEWHWCEHHKCWAQHKSNNCCKAKKVRTPDISASMAAVGIKVLEENISQE
jgi:aspartyl-tRNA synthetase